jgi:hypothetical protein
MRGLFPSLGAGGSLIAAALCALAVFGGVLAFRGEDPGTAEGESRDLGLPAAEVRARTVAQTAPRVHETTVSPRAAATRARTLRRDTAPASRRVIATLPRPNVGTPRPETAPKTPTAPTAPPATSTPAPTADATGTPTLLPPVATPAPPSVERAVAQTRAAAQPVVELAPQAVQAPVNALGATVQQVAGTVDQTVGGLLP